MANPFDVLPLNLFNLFITHGDVSLQRHYMAILLRIYALAEFNRFGLQRENVIAEILDYLREANAENETSEAALLSESKWRIRVRLRTTRFRWLIQSLSRSMHPF